MSEKPKCSRCGEVAETWNFEAETTFWGHVQNITETSVVRKLRVFSSYFRRGATPHLSDMLRSDESKPLCADCWGALVGRFLQGRSVPALPGKEGR